MRAGAAGIAIDAHRLWADVMALAAITDPGQPYTRRSFSAKYLEGRAWLAERMREGGLAVRCDAAGNLIGRREGKGRRETALMLGSHTDTVPGGGRFDGIAGVLAALEVARALQAHGVELKHPLEVVDFLAEEPSEFGVSCVGSRAMAGALDEASLAATAPGGETLAAAIGRMAGEPARIAEAQRADIAAFLELHIEQGPVLETERVDIGIVTAIVGIARVELAFAGEAAHAGTVPMAARRDAGVAGAEAMLWVRDRARALDRIPGYFVATTGIAELQPGASNVIPGAMRLVVDARSTERAALAAFVTEFRGAAKTIAGRNRVELSRFAVRSHTEPARCDARLRALLAKRARALGLSAIEMPSGAGHDAAFISRIAPAAMVFIACRAGRSHSAEEWAEPEALAKGARLLAEAVLELDRDAHGGSPGDSRAA